LLVDSIVKLTVRDYGRWHFAPRTPEEPQRYDGGDEPGGLRRSLRRTAGTTSLSSGRQPAAWGRSPA
jgi:hypothetical protein